MQAMTLEIHSGIHGTFGDVSVVDGYVAILIDSSQLSTRKQDWHLPYWTLHR